MCAIFTLFRSGSQRENNGCVRTCGEAVSHIYRISEKRKGNTKLSNTHGKARWGEGEIEFRTAAGKTPRGGLVGKKRSNFLLNCLIRLLFLAFLQVRQEELNKERKKRGGGAFLLFMAWVVYEKEGEAFFASKLRGNDDIHTRQSKSGFTTDYLK